jgi:N-methylhydantoinase B
MPVTPAAKRSPLAKDKSTAAPTRTLKSAKRPKPTKPAKSTSRTAGRGVTDPVALEVFSNSLLSIAEEMGALLIRTAYSINIKERQDASTAIFDAQGRLVAQAEHIPMHLGALLSIISNIQKRYPQDDIRPGDVFIANDAYHGGGTHLADVTVASPVFFEGQMIGYVANMGHWPDVGGMTPGGASSEGCTEIYQEGLRIPPMRIMREGKLQEDLFSFILLNMRFAEDRPADLRAQVAANQIGEQRLHELASKFGVTGYDALIQGVLDYNERTIRARIRELPEGTWSFEDQLDNDGHEPGPVPLKVALSVRHRPQPHIIFDFAGSSPQRTGGVNVVYEALFATVAFALKATLDPDLWSNAAFERVVKIVAPLGSIVNPLPPAPVGGRGTTCQRLADMLLGAIGKVAPGRVTACGHGTTTISLNGYDPGKNKRFICIDGIGGGMGGREGHDGMDAVQININNIPNLAAEILESEYPMRIERYELVPDTGGAGQYRGGLATRKDIRMLADTNFLAHADRHDFSPWGIEGAQDGSRGHHHLDPGTPGQESLPSKGGPFNVGKGQVLRCQSPGAGGFGDPARRDVERLAVDLADGKVTEANTRKMYPGKLVEAALQRARKL